MKNFNSGLVFVVGVLAASLIVAILILLLLQVFGVYFTNYFAPATIVPLLQTNRFFLAAFGAMMIGSSVGAVELIGRYRDEPFRALLVGSAFFYVLINGILSIVVFIGLYIFYKDTYFSGDLKDLSYAVFVAGFGSLAFMRTAIAKVQVGDQEVPIGPAQFIDTLLRAADNGVDRNRARKRLRVVTTAVKENNIEGEMKLMALRVVSLGAMQSLTPAERKQTNDGISKLLEAINKKGGPRYTAAISIGMLLQRRLGNKTFEEACKVVNDLEISAKIDSSQESPTKSFITKLWKKSDPAPGESGNSTNSPPKSANKPKPEIPKPGVITGNDPNPSSS